MSTDDVAFHPPLSTRLLGAASCVLLASACILFAGCEQKKYEVRLTPQGDSLERELTVWVESKSNGESRTHAIGQPELERLAAAYQLSGPEVDGDKRRFRSQFDGAMPYDLGGAGWYTPLKSPLGSVAGYVERVRGNDDLAGEVVERLTAANDLADILVGWLEAEIGDQPHFDRLRKVVDTDIRRDARNLAVYAFAFSIVDHQQPANEACVVRAVQYLIEREYFEPKELPHLMRAFTDASQNKTQPLLARVKRVLAQKMGFTDRVPALLKFFDDPDRLGRSISDYLVTSKWYQGKLAKWQADVLRGEAAAEQRPDPLEVLGELIMRACLPQFSLVPDQLKTELATPSQPFLTNGAWDAGGNRVVWSRSLPTADSTVQTPAILYAFWAQPNVTFQEQHFGKVLLVDQKLSDYCLLYFGLGELEAAQWDQRLAKVRPGDDLAQELEAFAFGSPTEAQDEAQSAVADKLKELLISQQKANASE